ncbi:MAG TPA: hypothetical protein VMT71_03865 [Syntrophorhabdales bacterium]|nr:hypothetical protein [Syntrophorhabdales bacterium]
MSTRLTPLLALAGLGLLASIFFVNVEIPWDDVNVGWVMAFVFHLPLLLFFFAAVMVEILTVIEKKHAVKR